MFVSEDGSRISLFDLLGFSVPVSPSDDSLDTIRRLKEQQELELRAKKLLGENARWGGQEFRLEIKDDAWVFVIFSCYEDRDGKQDLLRFIIPKDREKPVRVESLYDPIEAVIPERKTTVRP